MTAARALKLTFGLLCIAFAALVVPKDQWAFGGGLLIMGWLLMTGRDGK